MARKSYKPFAREIFPLLLVFLYALFGIYSLSEDNKDKEEVPPKPYQALEIQYDSVSDFKGIQEINDKSVKPVLYNQAVSLASLNVEKKKARFIDLMLPAILVAKFRIREHRRKVKNLFDKAQQKNLPTADSLYLDNKMETYRCEDIQELITKLHTHPPSIVLAQAALECGWGTSRFFVEGNNVFGIWSYDADEPRLKASYSRGDKSVYVRKYDNLALSIQDYFRTISRVPAYQTFVQKRLETSDPFKLVPHLRDYSELREIYVKRLKNMIRLNEFTQYDGYYIDSTCIKSVKELPT